MPRVGWRKSESDRRLADLVSVGVLAKVFPAEVVDAAVSDCGRVEQRSRSLPARAVAYFAMGMALHADGSYEDVLACMTELRGCRESFACAGSRSHRAVRRRSESLTAAAQMNPSWIFGSRS